MEFPWIVASLLALVTVVLVGLFLMKRRSGDDASSDETADVLREVIATLPEATVALEDGKIRFFNRAFLGLFRLPLRTEVEGRPLDDFVSANTPIDLLSTHDITPAPEGSAPRILEKAATRAVQIGRRRFELVAISDVTEDRLASATVEQTDRMVMIGTLAASAMHEVKNPLTSVKLNLEHAADVLNVLARSERPNPNAFVELSELLAETREGAERIELVADDLSSFSAPQKETLSPTDVAECVQSAVRMIQPQVRGTARVDVNVEDVELVLASEVRVRQMLINLLNNAAQAVAIQPGARLLSISCRMRGTAVVVEVTDNGPGIAAEHLDRIFDPLFTTKALGKGTGLGLYVVSRIAKRLDCRIDVDSEPGKGTTFRLTFARPVDRSISGSMVMPPTGTNAYTGKAARVLLVDDKLSFLNTLRREIPNHEVTFARSGNEAIKLLERKPFDVVLLDVIMPEVSGRDVYRAVAQTNPGAARSIIFMTGLHCDEEIRVWLDTLENEVLTKPFDIQSIVRERLDGVTSR